MVVVVGAVAVEPEEEVEDLEAPPTTMLRLHQLKTLGNSPHWVVASEMSVSALVVCYSCLVSLMFLLVWEFVLVIFMGSGVWQDINRN